MADEKELLIMLRDSLFIPFVEQRPERREEMENTFNTLFERYGLTFDSEQKLI